ncbi:MAG TPA: copper resistance CopC family protein [Trebonia sp.]
MISVAVGAIAFAIVSGVFLVGVAVPAAAQSYLSGSSPADGGKIDVAPSQVILEFTQPIRTTGYRVVVLGPTRTVAYQQLAAQITGDKLTQPLRPLGPPGEYQVEYRAVSADGLVLTGELRFTLTRPGPAQGGAAARNGPYITALTTVNDTRPWEVWTAGTLAVLLVIGAVLFGWRVTHDLD